jgi:hypothetical protein
MVVALLDNNIYNLMAQMVTESKSLWRIKNEYKKDASNDPKYLALWNELEKNKENNLLQLELFLREQITLSTAPKTRENPFEP